MFGKHRARMVATKNGYDFRGSLLDVVRMLACNIRALESRGYDVAELKHALLFLEKPENMPVAVYQTLQIEARYFLNTEAQKIT